MTMSPKPPSLRPRPSSHATRAEKWECRLWDISHTDGRTDGELVVLGKYGRAWQCWHWLESDDDTTLNFSSDSTKPPPPPLPLPAVPSSSWYINGLNTHMYNSLDRSFFLVIDGDGLTDSSKKERGRWTILILLDGFHFQSLSSLRVQSSPVHYSPPFSFFPTQLSSGSTRR